MSVIDTINLTISVDNYNKFGDNNSNGSISNMKMFNSALQIVSIAAGVIGLTGNTFVIVVIVGFTSMHKQLTNMFVVNQSIIDAVSSLIMTAQATSLVKNSKFFEGQIMSEIYCRLWYSQTILWGCYVSSTYNIVVLTIERYLKIVHPVFHKVSFTRRKAKILLVLVWLFGITFQISYIVPTTAIVKTKCLTSVFWPSAAVRYFMGYVIWTIQYWFPVLVFLIAYAKMIYKLRHIGPFKRQGNNKRNYYLNMFIISDDIYHLNILLACAH